MDHLTDEIRRDIVIVAPRERVWALISEPGWWVNTGDVHEHVICPLPDRPDAVRVSDEACGEFTVETLAVRPLESIRFRWRGGAEDAAPALASTTVEFVLKETEEGVRVTVVEAGWGGLERTPDAVEEFEENSRGWGEELAAAKRHLERA